MEPIKEFKFNELCKIMKLSNKQKITLREILVNPYKTHKELSIKLGIKGNTLNHCTDQLYKRFEAHGKVKLRDTVEYILS